MHTHTHTYYTKSIFFACKLQQMAVRLDALRIQTIFTPILDVAS